MSAALAYPLHEPLAIPAANDNARLLPDSLTTTGSAATALDLSYTYNARGRVSGMIDGVNADNTRAYGYDGQGRLTSATGPWGANGANAAGSYTYDSLGNLRSKQLGSRSVSLSYDDDTNRLSNADDDLVVSAGGTGNRDVDYDSRGNIKALEGQGFLYNAMNRPTSIAGDVDAVYRYDGHGRRVRSVVYKDTGYVLHYNVFGASGDLIFNVQIDQSPTDEDYVTSYVKMDGQTLARVKSEGRVWNYTDTVTYLHQDHLGSAASGTSADGSVAWREDYSPFGITLQNDAANDNQAGFTGHIKDSATGLNYMQARYYDPVIGRFLSIDPVTFMDSGDPGYFNRYAYTLNDPINLTDPTGMCGTSERIDGCVVTGSISVGSSDNPNIQNTRPDDVSGINGHAISGDGSPRESDFTDVDLSDLGGSLQTLAGTKGSALNTAINQSAANGGSVPVSMDEVIASKGFRGKTSTEQKRGIGRFSVAINGSVIAQTGKDGTSFNFVGAVSGELDSQDYGADSSRSPFARAATTYGRTRQRISGGQDYNITFFNHQTIDVRGTLPNP